MPGRDGTGPMGRGIMTGRGRGFCAVSYGTGLGLGLGYRRGLERGFFAASAAAKTEKEALEETKELIEKRLAEINMQPKSL
ncbi:MAG: hypothetical protein K0R84_2651 [Clostridia bacterium]|nr:hypothetical protein [Clostridia bacterium]